MGAKSMLRRNLIVFAAIVGTVTLGAPALAADNPTTQQLYEWCRADRNSPTYFQERAYCHGFINGIFDVMTAVGTIGPRLFKSDRELLQPFAACTPDAVTAGALRQVFINWAESHPTQWNLGPGAGVATALRTAWPCQAN